MVARRALIGGALAVATPPLFGARPAAARELPAHWPRTLTLAAGAVGGTFGVYASVWGQIAQRVTGVQISTRATQGGAQNTILVNRNEAELGQVAMGVALQGWNGTGPWTQGQRFRDVRALFPMFSSPFFFAALERTGIRSIADVAGRSIGVGPRGGFPGTYIPLLLEALDIRPAAIRYGNYADQMGQASDGLLDVIGIAAGLPAPAFSEFETGRQAVFFGFTPAQVATLVEKLPELAPASVPAGTYRSQTQDQPTVTVWNFAIVHRSLPDDLVHEIVQSVMENHRELVQGHSAAAETLPQHAATNTFMTWHPGAARYFTGKGIALPAATLAPPA